MQKQQIFYTILVLCSQYSTNRGWLILLYIPPPDTNPQDIVTGALTAVESRLRRPRPVLLDDNSHRSNSGRFRVQPRTTARVNDGSRIGITAHQNDVATIHHGRLTESSFYESRRKRDGSGDGETFGFECLRWFPIFFCFTCDSTTTVVYPTRYYYATKTAK